MKLSNVYLILISALLVTLSYFFVDRPLAEWMHLLPKEIVNLFKRITYVVSPEVVLTVLPLSLLIIKKHSSSIYKTVSLILTLALSLSITFLLKPLFGRTRPELFLNNGLFGFFFFKITKGYHSFPSSHATCAGALFGGLALIFKRFRLQLLATSIFFALTRVIINKHFLSDVIAGLCVGYFCANVILLKETDNAFERFKEQLLKKIRKILKMRK